MELYEKIKFIRTFKGWTQENLANKLGISTYAYAKIEQGKTDVNFSRLEQIAQVMEIDLPQLLGLDEKNVFNLSGNHNQSHNCYVNSSLTGQIEYKQKLEKADLIIEQQKTEIVYLKQENKILKQQIADLRDMNNLLKKQNNQ